MEVLPHYMLLDEIFINVGSQRYLSAKVLIFFNRVDERFKHKLEQSKTRSGLVKDSK